MQPKRTTDYIYTYSGQVIFPPHVRIEQIKLIDIAYALSGINRYNGHTRISVLRHSYALSQMFPNNLCERKYALLHDAPEAYMMDVPAPLQVFMSSAWHETYRLFEMLIFQKYDVNLDVIGGEVNRLDKRFVEYEMDKLESLTLSSMRYPAERTLSNSRFDEIDRAYRWHQSEETIRGFWLQDIRDLCRKEL